MEVISFDSQREPGGRRPIHRHQNHLTVLGCIIYFWLRLIHYIVYTMGIPGLRTLAFLCGALGEVLIAIALIQAM